MDNSVYLPPGVQRALSVSRSTLILSEVRQQLYRLFTAILVALLGYCISAGAEAPSVYAENGVAINGYDPVAYVELTVAHAGSEEFSAKWMGVTWRFLSQEHLDKFMTSPETYTPQYGGYCAYAVSQNGLAKTDH